MKKSIRSKLLVGAILPVIMGIVILIIVSVILVSNNVNKMTNKVINSQTSDIYYKIDGYFATCISSLNTYANTTEIANVFSSIDKTHGFSRYEKKDVLSKNLSEFKKVSSDISNYWIADLNASELLYDDGEILDANYKLNEQEWFKQLMIKKETTLTSPYISEKTGKEVISIVTMVKLNAFQNIGVVGLDIPTEIFIQKINEFRSDNENNLTIISEDGMILYDDNPDIVGHELHTTQMDSKLISAFDSKTSGEITYHLDSEEYIGSVLKSSSTGITLITGMPSKLFFESVNSLIIFLIIIGVVILVVVIIVIVIMAKNIVTPIKYLEKVSNEIADGNLNVEIDYKEENEIGNLAASLKKTVDRLNMYIENIDDVSYNLDKIAAGDLNIDIDANVEGAFMKIQRSLNNIRIKLSHTIRNVVNTSEEISYSSDQLTDGAQSLSESSIEQASSVDILSESIVNITEEINKTTEFTNIAHNVSIDTMETADLGNEQMKNLVSAMNEIMIVSNKIGKIVHTIEDIAFQTNTLSLNASIEAARAGDAGLGFAVVAGEVRKLANKTSNAAKETSDLIKSSISTVVKGNRLCDATSKSLEEILIFIRKQADIVEKIDLATKTQKTSINQIEEGIISISGAVQTNSATAEEAAASSEELSSQAKDMYVMMEEFTLYDGDDEIIEEQIDHKEEIEEELRDHKEEVENIEEEQIDHKEEKEEIEEEQIDHKEEKEEIEEELRHHKEEVENIEEELRDHKEEVEDIEEELIERIVDEEINRAMNISLNENSESIKIAEEKYGNDIKDSSSLENKEVNTNRERKSRGL